MPECAREVSALVDWMAVRAVYRELVSGPKSLIYQGKYREIAQIPASGEGQRLQTGPFSRSWPAFSLRSGTGKFLPTSTDSRQGAARRAEIDDCASLQYSEIAGVLGRPTFGTLRE